MSKPEINQMTTEEIASLKQQLKESVWKPVIKTYICRRDRQPKRKLLINLESNDINVAIKYKPKKKWQKELSGKSKKGN